MDGLSFCRSEVKAVPPHTMIDDEKDNGGMTPAGGDTEGQETDTPAGGSDESPQEEKVEEGGE